MAVRGVSRHRRHGAAPQALHTVGALFDLPHAETHAVLLPHTIAYNTPAARAAIGRAARALAR
nr:iron-containing alcohol dehydrogenase [Bradyrhizobium sp. 2S1]MCK7667596.1 iron-containing alcohol dehydrogenase [Bradyrhizobium sp. 2S1]